VLCTGSANAADHFSAGEKAAIAKLPQSKQEYATKASAQALIATFQELLSRYVQMERKAF